MKTLSGTRIGSGQHAPATAANTMHARVHHGPGNWAWEEKSRPVVVDAGDAVVRMTTSTICGTDLHILKGDVPRSAPHSADTSSARSRLSSYFSF